MATVVKAYLGSTPLFDNTSNEAYTRPSDWVAMPAITSSEQKIAVLFAVGNYSTNHIAFRMSGAYTVDWGDGNIEDFATNTTAQHVYNYSDLSASTEFDYSGQTGRQAMIIITPQSGQNLTSVSFNFRHSDLVGSSSTPILEIVCSAPYATAIAFGGTSGQLSLMEQCTILSHNATSLNNLFYGCRVLKSVPLFDTSSVTNFGNVFYACTSLKQVPSFNTSSATNMTNMFAACYSLETVPAFNTSSVTTMTQMFNTCYSLKKIPQFNTSSATSMAYMFNSCTSLQSVPLMDTSSVTNMGYMFQNCYSLQSIPALDCSSATNTTNYASNAQSLSRCQATGINGNTSFINCSLGSSELNEIYTNLSSSGTGKTITVTGNRGVASDDPSIATAKGWTVTG
jgi:surface protein